MRRRVISRNIHNIFWKLIIIGSLSSSSSKTRGGVLEIAYSALG